MNHDKKLNRKKGQIKGKPILLSRHLATTVNAIPKLDFSDYQSQFSGSCSRWQRKRRARNEEHAFTLNSHL